MSCLCNLESLKAVILRVILDPCCFLLPEIPSEEEEEAELQDVMDGKVKNLCSFPFTRATLEFSSAVQLVVPWPVLGGPY